MNRYTIYSACLSRLVNEYKLYKSLFVAFDFDNTVYDYHETGETYTEVEILLIRLQKKGCKLILFTGNEGKELEKATNYCISRGYTPDYINENPLMPTRKPYYNLLIDDRAGLAYTINLCHDLLKEIEQ
jgi:hypothetical protein